VSENSRETPPFDRRRALTLGVPIILAVLMSWFFPWGRWVWYALALVVAFILGWGWGVRDDWRRMYQVSFDFSDQTAKMAPPDARCYSVAVMKREAPPRLIWVVVVNDHGARVYMGWFLWSQGTPEFRKAVSRGVRRRQVA
jgi:hypothetical protein